MLLLKLSFRYLLAGRFTTKLIAAISFLGTFIATVSLILTVGVMNGFQKSVSESLLKHTPHVVVITGNRELSERVLRVVKRDFGGEVRKAFWFATFQLIFQHGKAVSGGVIYASRGNTLAEMLDLKENLLLGNLTRNGIVLGDILADNLNIDSIPTEVVLINPVAEETPIGFMPNIETVNATGIFSTGFYIYDTIALANYDYISKFFKPSSFNVVIQLKNPFEANFFKEKLLERFPSLFVNTWIDRNKDFFSALRLEKIASVLVVALIGLVATFNVFSLLLIKIGELKKDFAIFRTFGAGRGFIFGLVLLQGGFIGFLGALSGAAVAAAATFFVNKYELIRVPPDVYLVSHIPIVNGIFDYLWVSSLVVVLSLLASLVPAWISSRESVSRILRND
jgi:lipoprotein-releasing system permease protein